MEPGEAAFVQQFKAMELDEGTVRRAQRGDRAAQEAFVRRYSGPLHSFLWRAGGGRDVRDDVQDVLAKLLTVLPRFEFGGAASLSTWVFTIAHRWLLDQHKRRHLQVAGLDEAREVASTDQPADQRVAAQQLVQTLEQAIAQLPEAQRRVFVLAHVHEQPLDDIAREEGVPVGTVKSRLFRARALLAHTLGPALQEGVTRAVR